MKQIENNIDLLFSFFNQYNFNTAKENIEHLKYFYSTDISTSNNPLVHELLEAIDTYNFDAIGEPLFRSILSKCKKTDVESNELMACIVKWKKYTKEEIKPAQKYLNDIISAAIVRKAYKLYDESPAEYLKYLKNVNVPTADVDLFCTKKFKELDINSIIAESSKGTIPIDVRFLNKAFESQGGGLERGSIGLIVAAPGTGKSNFSMSLALQMASKGEKVVYFALGDLKPLDFIVRLGTIAFGITFKFAYEHILEVYTKLAEVIGDNLELSINPAGVVEADDIVDKVLTGGYTACFIDYDGNLAGVSEGDSMYNTYGDIYNKFTKLSLNGILTIICSQPKVYCWNQMIGLADIGESSKKQHICDWAVTISSPNQECPNHLHVMTLVKARRGNVGHRAYVIRIQGRFVEIEKGLYDYLKQETEEIEYTEPQIIAMNERYIQESANIKKRLQDATNNFENQNGPVKQNITPKVNPFV